jgi:hypothetical protein
MLSLLANPSFSYYRRRYQILEAFYYAAKNRAESAEYT